MSSLEMSSSDSSQTSSKLAENSAFREAENEVISIVTKVSLLFEVTIFALKINIKNTFLNETFFSSISNTMNSNYTNLVKKSGLYE